MYLCFLLLSSRGQSPSRDSGSPLVTEDDAVSLLKMQSLRGCGMCGMQVWVELGISRENLIRWTENCRRVSNSVSLPMVIIFVFTLCVCVCVCFLLCTVCDGVSGEVVGGDCGGPCGRRD